MISKMLGRSPDSDGELEKAGKNTGSRRMRRLNIWISRLEKGGEGCERHSSSVCLSLWQSVPRYCVFLHFDRLWVGFIISPTNQPVFHACISEMAYEVR